MIVRIDIHRSASGHDCRVIADGDVQFEEAGYGSVVHALAGAVEQLAPEVRAVEIACDGVVSGTYPLDVLANHAAQVAQHAVNTTAAVEEALRGA